MKTIKQSLFFNTVARIVTEIFNRFGAAIFWVLVARYLGVSALGALAFALSLHSFFLAISTFGLGAVLIRDVARDRSLAGLYLAQCLAFGSVLATVAAAVMVGFAWISGSVGDTLIVTSILAAALVPSSIFYWSKSLLTAAEQMHKIAFARLIENSVKVVAGVTLLFCGGTILEMAFILFLSKTVSAIILFMDVRRKIKPIWRIDRPLLVYFARLAPSFGLTSLGNCLFWTMPVILLARLAGDYQAGLFAAAYKLVDVAVSFSLAYGQALFPVAARSAKDISGQFRSLLTKSVKYSLMLSPAIAIGLVMLAHPLIRFIYGTSMLESAPVLSLLAWMLIPFSLVPVLAYSLVSRHLQRYDVFANTIAACLVIGLGFALVPSLGARGTALSIVAGTLVYCSIEWIGVRRNIYRLSLSKHIWKPACASFVMAGVLYFFNNSYLLFAIALAGVTYVISLILSKAITKRELLIIKRLKPV